MEYDIIVIGAGHAGCEAALAGARMDCKVLLLGSNLDTVAQMSCNPAIGGLAKGHLVREIDALGGEMGKNIDATGIQFRILNRKKGPAVWASRAQADKKAYQQRMKGVLERQNGVDLKQETGIRIIVEGDSAVGVACLTGNIYKGKSLVVATGTFLDAIIHIGDMTFPGGRAGENASVELAASIRELGFTVGRLKTGTSPRINMKDVALSGLARQDGDEIPTPFSFSTKKLEVAQSACYLTYTTSETKDIVMRNIHRSPLYGGKIKATGVRYCPSIEDKMVKFPDKDRHQIFIEPEGRDTAEVYLNGASTSFPYDVQLALVRSITGLDRAEIMRPGYAVEYDYCPPTQLYPTLETKIVKNLYMAGQINGTSGYEEAAAQGLVAGINAALKVKGLDPFILDRSEAYIGVLIDDLVIKGTMEPYRMFTSRAEYRLFLRQDNADARLMHYGKKFGLITDEQMETLRNKLGAVSEGLTKLREARLGQYTGAQLLRRPEISYRDLRSMGAVDLPVYDDAVIEQIEIEIKYDGYLKRQSEEIAKMRKMESRKIPEWIDFTSMSALKKEAREKLQQVRPLSIGQAARISGITPADISILTILLEKQSRHERASA